MTAINDIAALTVICRAENNQVFSNTIHIHKAGAGLPSDTDLLNLATEFNTWIGSSYAATLRTGSFVERITCAQVPEPSVPGSYERQSVFPATAGTAGAISSDVPLSIASVLELRTPTASKRARGHLFFPPPRSNSVVAAGNLFVTSGSIWTAWVTLASKYDAGKAPSPSWTGTNLHGWNLCIYSKTGQALAQPSVFDVTSTNLDTKVHWLRSRERGGS